MDMQKMLDYVSKASRADELKTSPIFLLCELIAKLEGVRIPELPVVISDEYEGIVYPVGFDSWRGSYCELSLSYTNKAHTFSVKAFIAMCKNCIGKTFEGYKGGEFLMGKNTPVWVDNYGVSRCVALVGVVENEDNVTLLTKHIEL